MKLAIMMVLMSLPAALMAAGNGKEEFFVAKDGDDKNPGTKLKPFATLERARDAIRSLRSKTKLTNGATVWIREGIYQFEKTFQLSEEDGNTSGEQIVYRSVEGEIVRFVGGKEITGFKPVTDPEVLERIDKPYRDKILQVDLKELGITDYGKLSPRGFSRPIRIGALELFFNDKPMTLARWPNGDEWSIIADAPDGPDAGKFVYDGDRPRRWKKANDIWLHGYWTWAWADSYEKVKSIDTEKREISTEPPHGIYGYSKGKRYYAFNLLEELDQPGEWYLDRNKGILYFWPPEPIENGKCFVSMMEEPLVSLKGCSRVKFQGITFECCRGSAFEMSGGTKNVVAGCTFRNIGNIAIWIGGELRDYAGITYRDTTFVGDAGTENTIVSCDIYHCGDGGIVVGGGDRKTLTPAANCIVNNHIYDFSHWVRTYRPAIGIYGVGNIIAHNVIHDGPHSAILINSGNENIVEYNEIYRICMETGDAGAFYIGRDWSMQGNVVRYNYFHDLGGYNDTLSLHKFSDTMAVYLDDWASGTMIYGNIFHKANRAILIGSGRDNTVDNNIFVNCNPCIHIDARGLSWADKYFDGSYPILFERLKVIHHDKPPYSTKYPSLAKILDDEPSLPKNNVIVHNISVGGEWLDLWDDIPDKTIIKAEDNFTEGDPGFVDAEKGDFRLKEESPAFKTGFNQIPVEKIGLYKDDYRGK